MRTRLASLIIVKQEVDDEHLLSIPNDTCYISENVDHNNNNRSSRNNYNNSYHHIHQHHHNHLNNNININNYNFNNNNLINFASRDYYQDFSDFNNNTFQQQDFHSIGLKKCT